MSFKRKHIISLVVFIILLIIAGILIYQHFDFNNVLKQDSERIISGISMPEDSVDEEDFLDFLSILVNLPKSEEQLREEGEEDLPYNEDVMDIIMDEFEEDEEKFIELSRYLLELKDSESGIEQDSETYDQERNILIYVIKTQMPPDTIVDLLGEGQDEEEQYEDEQEAEDYEDNTFADEEADNE